MKENLCDSFMFLNKCTGGYSYQKEELSKEGESHQFEKNIRNKIADKLPYFFFADHQDMFEMKCNLLLLLQMIQNFPSQKGVIKANMPLWDVYILSKNILSVYHHVPQSLSFFFVRF